MRIPLIALALAAAPAFAQQPYVAADGTYQPRVGQLQPSPNPLGNAGQIGANPFQPAPPLPNPNDYMAPPQPAQVIRIQPLPSITPQQQRQRPVF